VNVYSLSRRIKRLRRARAGTREESMAELTTYVHSRISSPGPRGGGAIRVGKHNERVATVSAVLTVGCSLAGAPWREEDHDFEKSPRSEQH